MLEQSPIDISVMESHRVRPNANHDERIESVLGHVDAELVHQGTNFQVNWKSEKHNYLKINGKVFHTVQFHFHTPSEHTINGKQMDMEFHLVHQADDGNLAVVALFFQQGQENQFLAQFWDELPGMHPEERNKLCIGKIQGDHLNLLAGDYFRYRGSLTTPPYTEGVEWIVISDVAEASREQIETFREALPSASTTGTMEQIMQMQDDIHKLKKMMDMVFEKIETHSADRPYDAVDAYADKDRIVEMLNRLSARMAEADMSSLTATPTKDATPEEITQLKQSINEKEAERQSIYRRAGASLKGVL
ncbi:TPA: hypothetical protein N0F65_008157 [Lagenidium giganteum]|uniref:carbonic anhydrase n=1 Tax=Lagenidium giganteum TaxID=4803 RepID=A0AAV2YLN4_9STRA|nr:TPA: hypothetical protein N0F65_008157 [Lagenidium giganteum]